MGAKVRGQERKYNNASVLKNFYWARRNVVQDRIKLVHLWSAAAMTGQSDLLIEDAIWGHNRPLPSKDAKMV